ncbi:hypothetical protein GCM10010275_37440 [Streptomyces litmocidini]|nr:hypothetical protein GCM10010275_37440 [Streptomyces litmocidini]
MPAPAAGPAPDRRRQAGATPGELQGGPGSAVRPRLPDGRARQADRVAGPQRLHGEPHIGVEAGRALPSRHEDAASRPRGQRRTDLLGAPGTVHDEPRPQPACRPSRRRHRDRLGRPRFG